MKWQLALCVATAIGLSGCGGPFGVGVRNTPEPPHKTIYDMSDEELAIEREVLAARYQSCVNDAGSSYTTSELQRIELEYAAKNLKRADDEIARRKEMDEQNSSADDE